MAESVNSLCYAALQTIKDLGLQPTPNAYEVFFTYHEGSNLALKDFIDGARQRGQVDADFVSGAYLHYLADFTVPESIITLSEELARSIGETRDLSNAVADTSKRFGGVVAGAQVQIRGAEGGVVFREIVAGLAKASIEAERETKATGEQLTTLNSRIASLSAEVDSIRKDAFTDALTGVGNRRAFDRDILTMIADAESSGAPMSLCLFDIDHFKKFNDRYGHPLGDIALKRVAATVKNCLRSGDIVHRYGGEEFAVLLPLADVEVAKLTIERIRQTISSVRLRRRDTNEDLGNLTASFGIAVFQQGDDAPALIERADSLLYTAKNNGRNRIVAQVTSSVLKFQPRG